MYGGRYSIGMNANERRQEIMKKHRVDAGHRSAAEMQAFFDELISAGLMAPSDLSWFSHEKVKHNVHHFDFAER